jgi:hypothetical protein
MRTFATRLDFVPTSPYAPLSDAQLAQIAYYLPDDLRNAAQYAGPAGFVVECLRLDRAATLVAARLVDPATHATVAVLASALAESADDEAPVDNDDTIDDNTIDDNTIDDCAGMESVMGLLRNAFRAAGVRQ